MLIEWVLGLAIPLLVAGPLCESTFGWHRIILNLYADYVVQILRFQVDEGFGCANDQDNSILGILILGSWSVIPPLLSVFV